MGNIALKYFWMICLLSFAFLLDWCTWTSIYSVIDSNEICGENLHFLHFNKENVHNLPYFKVNSL